MTARDCPIVVLGIGNPLLRDDAVGVRLVEALELFARRDPTMLPADTRLFDGGTLDLDLLRVIEGSAALLLIDGVDLGWPPGEVRVLRGDAILSAGEGIGSSAGGSVGELLGVARLMGWLPDHVSLLGVQVEEVTLGLGITPTLEAALPRAIDTALLELASLEAAVAGSAAAESAAGSDARVLVGGRA